LKRVGAEIDHKLKYPSNSANVMVTDILNILNRFSGSADELGSYVLKLRDSLKNQDLQLINIKKDFENLKNEVDENRSRDQIIEGLQDTIKNLINNSFESGMTTNPTAVLSVRNIIREKNFVTFDLYLVHTNPELTYFEYAGGQYFFNFNSEIANGGTLTYSLIDSDLPLKMRPRNPTVYGNQLRLASNSLPGARNGFVIPKISSGIKIAKMKLSTSAEVFSHQSLKLELEKIPRPKSTN
jgi:hypothetical protein